MTMIEHLDKVVYDQRFTPYFGWHDQHRGVLDYKPAAQQVRSEFMGLVEATGSGIRCLQIGLGIPGGTHLLFEQLFTRVFTIDNDPNVIMQFIKRFGDAHDLFCGDTRHAAAKIYAARHAPYDLLFIDGDHTSDGVLLDWMQYNRFVRPGGIVAFHDAAHLPDVYRVVNQLSNEREMHMIGEEVGIAWTRM